MPPWSLANCSFLPSLKSALSSSHIVALKSIAREFHHRLLCQTPECSSHILSDCSVHVELQRAAVVSTFTSFYCNRVLRRSLALGLHVLLWCSLVSFFCEIKITITSIANDQNGLPIFCLIVVSTWLERALVLLSGSFTLFLVKRRAECSEGLARRAHQIVECLILLSNHSFSYV